MDSEMGLLCCPRKIGKGVIWILCCFHTAAESLLITAVLMLILFTMLSNIFVTMEPLLSYAV